MGRGDGGNASIDARYVIFNLGVVPRIWFMWRLIGRWDEVERRMGSATGVGVGETKKEDELEEIVTSS